MSKKGKTGEKGWGGGWWENRMEGKRGDPRTSVGLFPELHQAGNKNQVKGGEVRIIIPDREGKGQT